MIPQSKVINPIFKLSYPSTSMPLVATMPSPYAKRGAGKTSNGWYQSGCIAMSAVYWPFNVSNQAYPGGEIGVYPLTTEQYYSRCGCNIGIASGSPAPRLCIFALPSQYCNVTTVNYPAAYDNVKKLYAEWFNWTSDFTKDNGLYDYYIVTSHEGYPVKREGLIVDGDRHLLNDMSFRRSRSYYTDGYVHEHFPDQNNVFNGALEGNITPYSTAQILGMMHTRNKTIADSFSDGHIWGQELFNSPVLNCLPINPANLALLESYLSNPDDILCKTKWIEIGTLISLSSWYSYPWSRDNALVARQITTDLPIFTLSSIDQMREYFAGNDYKPDNRDELARTLSNIPTQWDVYINGRNRPEIMVRPHSNAWEVWQGNPDDNTAGYSLAAAESTFGTFIYATVDGNDLASSLDDLHYEMATLQYDGSFNTNYVGLTEAAQLRLLDPAAKHLNFSSGAIGALRSYPAKVYMYLTAPSDKDGTPVQSSECVAYIGVIGDPDLDDFARLIPQNYGGIAPNAFDDGSTVILHYGEYPPDDPRHEPEDPPPTPKPPPDTPVVPSVGTTVLTRTYRVPENFLNDFGDFLWTGTFMDNVRLLNNNPIENVVGVIQAPIFIEGSPATIVCGNVDSTISAYEITSVPIYKVGRIQVKGMYGNFLDYSPYTSLSIFLPYIGFYTIDPNLYMGKSLELYYALDILKGCTKALIYLDGIYVQSFDGNAGVDIELTASNNAQRAAQALQSSLQLVPQAIETMASRGKEQIDSFKKFATGAYEAGLNAVFAPYHSQRSGSYSPRCGEFEPQMAYIAIESPTVYYPANYAHEKGYPLMKTKTLGQCNGFTIVSGGVDLSGFTCTQEELEMIRGYLTSGVYL